MAGKLSTWLSNKLLDHTYKTTPYPVPDNIYIALTSVVGDKDTPGTELSGNGYGRVQYEVWDTGAAGATENTNTIAFSAATGGDWVEAVGYEHYDAITGGNYLCFGDLDTARTIEAGSIAEFSAGELDVSIT